MFQYITNGDLVVDCHGISVEVRNMCRALAREEKGEDQKEYHSHILLQ